MSYGQKERGRVDRLGPWRKGGGRPMGNRLAFGLGMGEWVRWGIGCRFRARFGKPTVGFA